jgi:hypothetical protein
MIPAKSRNAARQRRVVCRRRLPRSVSQIATNIKRAEEFMGLESTTFKQMRTALLATAIAVGGISYAMAQSAPAPAHQSGGVNATPGTNTDPGTAGQSGNTKGTPALKSRKDGSRATTGSGAARSDMKKPNSMANPAKRSMERNPSPTNPNTGTQHVQ